MPQVVARVALHLIGRFKTVCIKEGISKLERLIKLYPGLSGRSGDNYENGVHEGIKLAIETLQNIKSTESEDEENHSFADKPITCNGHY